MQAGTESQGTRLVEGALAGLVATAPMTAVMRRLHRRLGKKKRYPLPPREIVSAFAPAMPGPAAINTTLAAHFAYGALSGAALAGAVSKPSMVRGIGGGVAIWLASYLGWIPGAGILKPATEHPRRRNKLMIVAHVVWGAAFTIARRELASSREAFADGRMKDAVHR